MSYDGEETGIRQNQSKLTREKPTELLITPDDVPHATLPTVSVSHSHDVSSRIEIVG